MKFKILGAIALCAISFNALSHNSPYWVGSSGDYVRGGEGGCVRTIFWTPETALPECENGGPQYRSLNLASSATFELGGSTLSASGKDAVSNLLTEFDGKQIKSIIVEGHTDTSGDASFNQHLSEQRAEAVKAELIADGIDGKIIKTIGRGDSMPIADNDTREGRAKNRRVEIKIDAREQE